MEKISKQEFDTVIADKEYLLCHDFARLEIWVMIVIRIACIALH